MVHNHKTAEEVSYFKVEVGFASEEGEGPFSIPDGIWYGLAKDEASAENLAYEQCWDRRLTSVSCSPVFNCEKLPRYFSCAAWGHPFVGNREEITRFIYDCAKKSLVAAQVRNGRAWINLDTWPMADLLKSIHDNDAIENPDDFDLSAFDSLPSWSDVESHSESTPS